MMDRSEAEEHLRVIRSLMEKATLYRAISAPTAVVGGLLTLAVGIVLAFPLRDWAENPVWFFGPWLIVLAITGGANAYFIHRDAVRRGDPFFSPGMKMALRALAPSHLVAGWLTLLAVLGAAGFGPANLHTALPAAWCVAYGLGLLAMEHFAPRSLICLGWSFLTAGLAIVAAHYFDITASVLPGFTPAQIANLTMAATFGVFHIAYAVCAWPREARAAQGAIA